ncbi:ATP-binding protein [Bremerella cremea]|uniref:ATP-binding protein n=1 Tax=Bremerella cremea TaxID=1031537 RepID=UPI0031E8D194
MISNKSSRPGSKVNSAEIAQLRVRRLSQLALIAGFGMLGIITVLVAYTYSIHASSAHLETRLLNCRIAIQRALVGINRDATTKLADVGELPRTEARPRWLKELEAASRSANELAHSSALSDHETDLEISTNRLRAWHDRTSQWQLRQRLTRFAAEEKLNRLQYLTSELRSEIEHEKGHERLDAILEFRRAAQAESNFEHVSQLAKSAIRASRASHLEGDLAQLQLAILQLAAEVDRSELEDRVQNQIRPRLLRIKSSVVKPELRKLVYEIEQALFERASDSDLRNAQENGLVILQAQLTDLQREKRALLQELQDAIAALNVEQEQIDHASVLLSERLGTHFVSAVVIVWSVICLCALTLSIVFWKMGKRVSTHICNQVEELDTVAHELNQEKIVLTVTQQKLQREFQCHKVTQEERERLFSELASASRQAGMAEMATSVLHNVGNVLNSINVSTQVVIGKLKTRRAAALKQACQLMGEHQDDLGAFFANDPRGKKLPEFLDRLADLMSKETEEVLGELACLDGHVDHVKQIVNTQQAFAKVTNLQEPVDLERLLDDAVKINEASMKKHEIEVIREIEMLPQVITDKNKVLQILVNLVKNAKQSVCKCQGKRWIRLRVRARDADTVVVQVIDNGVGIAPEHMPKMFTHGFTTKKDGHGFGLHSGALTAKELGGSLTVQSEGVGSGASFTLALPRNEMSTPQEEEVSQDAVDVHQAGSI